MQLEKIDIRDRESSADISFGEQRRDKMHKSGAKIDNPRRNFSKELNHLSAYKVKQNHITNEIRSKSASKSHSVFRKETFLDRQHQEIFNENQRLLSKMTKIHNEKQELAKLIERPIGKKDKTLNRPQRKRRLINIMEQNKQMLGRLKEQKSEYSLENCNRWRWYQEKLLKAICKYPYHPLLNTNSFPVEKSSPKSYKNIADFEKYIQEQEKEQKEMLKKLKAKGESSQVKLRTLTPTVKIPNYPIKEDYIADSVTLRGQDSYIGLNRSAIKEQIFNEEKLVIFKKSKILNNTPFVVEISSMYQCFLINAYSMENSDMFSLRIPKRKGDELFQQFNYNYDEVANQLRIIGGKLLLRLFAKEQMSLGTSRINTPRDSKLNTPITSRHDSPQRNRSSENVTSKYLDSFKLKPFNASSSSLRSKSTINKKESTTKLYIERVTNTDFSTTLNELIQRKSLHIENSIEEDRGQKTPIRTKIQTNSKNHISGDISFSKDFD